jgi:bifunctional ADP-heptose synthase (sugar kinase/adenylyltransferase)
VDTRTKIAEAAQCARRLDELRSAVPGVRVVSGYFDPLLAGHAARLDRAREGSGALAVVVLDPPEPILPARARAELVAALEAVSLVLVPAPGEQFAADQRLEDRDLEERSLFAEHVRRRQS